MKPVATHAWLFVLLLFVGPAAGADGVPAATNVPGRAYPKVHADRSVTFQIKAPEARKVQVAPRGGDNGLGRGPFDMQRGGDGTWSVTIPPAQPGFHYYELILDGAHVNDPNSETFFGWAQPTSGIEIPDPRGDFYAAKDVPHGEVRAVYYHSKITGAMRRAMVYTPPGYDRVVKAPGSDLRDNRRYPVLYLQHGSGESERAWSQQGRVNFILDNLIAAGTAVPMIVVMENGYAVPVDNAGKANDRAAGFGRVLVEEVVPMIAERFRTAGDREHRALAGLSMGAMQAIRIGLANPDVFGSIGCFSGAERNFDPKTSHGGAMADAGTFNAQWRLLWIGRGAQESPEGRVDFHESLAKHGIKHVWYECDGTHEWQVWRFHFRDFAQRLFRNP